MTASHATSHSRGSAATSNRRLGDLGSKAMSLGGAIGVGGIVLSAAIATMTDAESGGGWPRFFESYLTAFMFVLSICLGALFFVMIHHAVKAGWSVVLRRLAEGVASNLTWFWIAFLPIVFFGIDDLYHWIHSAGDSVLESKSPYFFFRRITEADHGSHIPWFWLLRAAAFLGLWAFLANWYFKKSVQQDATGDLNLTRQMERFAPPALLMFGLSMAFASMDWVMTREPHWFSTMFPVYFFAASCCGFFAVQILLMHFIQRSGRLTHEITAEHYQDAGKLLFAFGIVFWAYIAYSQYMLIWYANIPEETPWYFARQSGGWLWVSLLLLFGHFAGPFLVLISKHPKRNRGLLAAAAAWMLVMHFFDIYWLTMPTVPAETLATATSYSQWAANATNEQLNYDWHLLDFTCLLGLAGLAVAGTAWRLSGCSLIPQEDPRLHESLAFENI